MELSIYYTYYYSKVKQVFRKIFMIPSIMQFTQLFESIFIFPEVSSCKNPHNIAIFLQICNKIYENA